MRDSLGRERLVPRARLVLLVALAAAAIGALLLRVVSIVEPLGIDQSLWASAVRGIARGQRLYADVWEQRPPGIYWIYLAGFSVFGWTPAAVAWLDILASAACTLLLFVIGRRHGHASTGLVAAMLYATLTMPAWLYRHHGFLERSVSETFIALCVAASACLALRVRDRSSLTAAAGVGLFAGAAAVFKPNAILYLPALLAWIAVYAWGGRAPAISRPWRLFAVAVITAAIVPALAIVWLWRLGVIGDASVAVIEFNRFYVSQGLTPGGLALAFSKAVWFRMKSDPLWLAGSVAAAIAVYDLATKRQLAPIPGLAVLWGGAAALVILVNGIRLYNSYFIQALAPLALLSACMLTDAVRSTWPRRLIAAVTAALMVALLVERHYAARVLDAAAIDFQVLRGEVDRRAFLERFGGYNNGRGYSARANLELAEYVRGRTHPDDRIYLFGISGAGVYFDSDRLTAHRFLRVNFFVPRSFPDPSFDLQAVCRDLARQRPRYIIFERLHSSQDTEMRKAADSLSDHPDVQELLRPYRLETTIEDFTLYRLSD